MSRAFKLHPTGNAEGYYFLILNFGKQIVVNNWNTLPKTAEVIAIVQQLAKACKKCKGIIFTDKDGNTSNDDKDPERENK